MTLRRTLQISVIIAGATAMASQIVFLREFMVVFYGNEISVGIILASWLIWGALGSWGIGRFSDRVKSGVRLFSICQMALFFVLPLTLFMIRSARNFLGVTTGEILGYYPMAIVSFAVLSVSCALLGFMFSLACRIYEESGIPSKRIAKVYILEAVGALSSGLLVSYFLIRFTDPVNIVFMLAFLNILGSALLQAASPASRPRSLMLAVTIAVLLVSFVCYFTGGRDFFRKRSLGLLWKGYDVLESRDSVYGNITVTEKGIQRSFYENGLNLYTVPDPLSSEEAVHFALLEDRHPEDVLLIGGGAGGLIKEILKYPVKRVDYVELDPTIVEMAGKYLSYEDALLLDRPEVNIINEDGRFFVKRTDNKYDCIILHLGDPYTAQLNRFYTVEFFREVDRILKSNGVFSFGLTSTENYIGEELRLYLSSIFLSLKEVFTDIFVIPGDTAYFLASNGKNVFARDYTEYEDRLKELRIDTQYVRDYYLASKLSPERLTYAEEEIGRNGSVRTNTDFKPISYFYATAFWSTHFDTPWLKKFLASVTSENIWLSAVAICAFGLLFSLMMRRRKPERAALLAVFTTGFAEISFQIAVILSFQVIYGFVFYKLGIIVTSFMVGLALGGWFISERMEDLRDDLSAFTWTQVCICIYPLILPVVFWSFSHSGSRAASWIGSNMIFPFLPVISGFIGGIQFPLANKIFLGGSQNIGRVAGLSYGLDLTGACAGSVLAAAFLVPVLGIYQSCFLVAMLNFTVLGVLLLGRSGAKRVKGV